jgi:hypothetical protein
MDRDLRKEETNRARIWASTSGCLLGRIAGARPNSPPPPPASASTTSPFGALPRAASTWARVVFHTQQRNKHTDASYGVVSFPSGLDARHPWRIRGANTRVGTTALSSSILWVLVGGLACVFVWTLERWSYPPDRCVRRQRQPRETTVLFFGVGPVSGAAMAWSVAR